MEHKRYFQPVSVEQEDVGKAVVNTAYLVHKELGPGLFEKAYEVCYCHVLARNGYNVQ